MSSRVTDWVAEKLVTNDRLEVISRTAEDFLVVKSRDHDAFVVSVLGVKGVIGLRDVDSLFGGATKPQLVINVPSETLWSGAAINRIHAAPAAFGRLGDVVRAASTGDAGAYRDKNMGFFINGMKQHSNVSNVSYIYDTVFKAHRKTGDILVVAVVDTYNMSAEDVRNCKTQFGDFDVIVKASSHGSITHPATTAARSMGAEALTFGQLLARLGK